MRPRPRDRGHPAVSALNADSTPHEFRFAAIDSHALFESAATQSGCHRSVLREVASVQHVAGRVKKRGHRVPFGVCCSNKARNLDSVRTRQKPTEIGSEITILEIDHTYARFEHHTSRSGCAREHDAAVAIS
jgi:hypothetical protein